MKNIISIQSHVVYGRAGNSAAVFPMCRMGLDVWPINTVQFSNHTQYGKWTGSAFPAMQLLDLVEGIDNIEQLHRCDAVLSGYIGSAEQGAFILQVVEKIKTRNPSVKYFCDPVMGHPEKGCIVSPGVAEFFRDRALNCCDYTAPNLLELELLTDRRINNVKEAITAAKSLCYKGVELVLVKNLSYAGYDKDQFEMLLVTKEHAWHIVRPLIDFGKRQPVGVGDITSGLLLANILLGKALPVALEHTTSAVYEIVMETYKRKEYELQIVAAQDRIITPGYIFKATQLE